MYINRFFGYITTLLILAGCTGPDTTTPSVDWFDEYENMQAGTPSQMYGTLSDGYGTNDASTDTHRMAVLLPLSGDSAALAKLQGEMTEHLLKWRYCRTRQKT